jgi:hypothetical protein
MSGDSEIEALRQLIENQKTHVKFLTEKVDVIKREAKSVQIINDNKFMEQINSFTNYLMDDSFDGVEYNSELAKFEEQRYKNDLASAEEDKEEAEADLAVMETELRASHANDSITLAGKALVKAAKEVVESVATAVAARRVMETDVVFAVQAELARKREAEAMAVEARVAMAAVVGARVGARVAQAARVDAWLAALGEALNDDEGGDDNDGAVAVVDTAVPSRETAPILRPPASTRFSRLLGLRRGGMATRKKYYGRRNKRKTKHYKKKTKRYTKKRNNYY